MNSNKIVVFSLFYVFRHCQLQKFVFEKFGTYIVILKMFLPINSQLLLFSSTLRQFLITAMPTKILIVLYKPLKLFSDQLFTTLILFINGGISSTPSDRFERFSKAILFIPKYSFTFLYVLSYFLMFKISQMNLAIIYSNAAIFRNFRITNNYWISAFYFKIFEFNSN